MVLRISVISTLSINLKREIFYPVVAVFALLEKKTPKKMENALVKPTF